MQLRLEAKKKEGENFALMYFRNLNIHCRLSGEFESRCFSGMQKRVTSGLDGNHTFHSAFNVRNRPAASVVQNRPAPLEPILCLFDCADFSFVTAVGDNERKGLTPIYFYHRLKMGISKPQYKFPLPPPQDGRLCQGHGTEDWALLAYASCANCFPEDPV